MLACLCACEYHVINVLLYIAECWILFFSLLDIHMDIFVHAYFSVNRKLTNAACGLHV